MKFKKFNVDHFEEWSSLVCLLFPNLEAGNLKAQLWNVAKSKKHKIYFAIREEEIVGFIHIHLSDSYSYQTDSNISASIVGLYVKEKFRRTGLAQELIKKAEKWVWKKGCTNIISRTNISDDDVHQFLYMNGYSPKSELINFHKPIIKT